MRIKVYPVQHPRVKWMVRYLQDGRRVRKYFRLKQPAEDYAAGLRAKLEAHGAASFQVAAHESAEFRAAREILPRSVSLTEAARFYMQHRAAAPVRHGPTVREAWVAFFETRLDRSPAYRKQLESQCEPLLEALGWKKRLAAQEAGVLETTITAAGGAQETRNNRRRMLATFTKWATARFELPRDPMVSVRRWEVKRGSPRFYTVDQLQRLLEAVARHSPFHVAGVAVRAFAGIRDIELKRMVRLGLVDGDVRPATQTILIRAEVAKATGPEGRGRPRLLEGLPPALWAWLEASPPLWWPANSAAILRPCFKLAQVEPIKNGLRHSFVTYAAAWYESLEKAAMVAGHDTDVLRAHYLGLATKVQAQAWFGVLPIGW